MDVSYGVSEFIEDARRIIEVLSPGEGLSIHVLGADLRLQRRRIFDVQAGTCQEVEGVTMAR